MNATAAVLRSPGGPLTIESVQLDDPRPHEVIVELVGTGVCHTDISFRSGAWPFPLPAVLGHEGAGTVVEVGAAVRSLKRGDPVVLSAASCGACPACYAGRPAQCSSAAALNMSGSRPDGSSPIHDSAGEVHGNFVGQSSFATHVLTEARFAVKVPRDVPLELLGPLGCGIQTGAGAVLNVLQPRPGSSVAVVGMGAVGLSAVAAAKVSGASSIMAIDVNPERLERASAFGATDLIDAAAVDPVEAVHELHPLGVDASIEASGAPAAFDTTFGVICGSGTCVVVGAAPVGTSYQLDATQLLAGRRIIGSTMGNSTPQIFIPYLIEMWRRGKLPLDQIVRHYPLSKINTAFADAERGTVVKPIITFGE